jgi:hypothetical protein
MSSQPDQSAGPNPNLGVAAAPNGQVPGQPLPAPVPVASVGPGGTSGGGGPPGGGGAPGSGGTSRPGWRAVVEKFWGYFATGNHPGRSWLLALIVLVAVILISAVGGTKNLTGRPLTGWAYVLTVLTMLLITFIVGLALRAGGTTLSALVKGSDNRTSTSKTQYVLWTVGVAFALTYISARTVLGPNTFVCDPNDKSAHNCVPDGPIWQQYLILLGVPAAAAVIAKATTTYQVSNGLIQTGQSEQATVADVATDYSGQADLSDVQYLVFNIIAFLYFFAHFLHAGTFVSVPSLLLGLTSASAATYTLTKALQTSKPSISTVLPTHIVPDATVTVTGQNLFPSGASEATVLLGSLTLPLINSAHSAAAPGTRDTGTFTAPPILPAGNQTLTVLTSASVRTDGYTVSCDQPALLGWAASQPAAGAAAVLKLSRLLPGAQYQVAFGSVIADATATGSNLQLTVPTGLASGADLPTTVYADGLPYASTTLQLAQS